MSTGRSYEPKQVRKYFESKLPNIRWKGSQGAARCPFHPDRRASLSVNDTGVFFCHACNAKGNLVEFERRSSNCSLKLVKKRIAKLANRGGGSSLRPRVLHVYSYDDESGETRFQQVRFEPKDFRFRRPTEDGGYVWNLQGVTKILYRLSEVVAADEVYVVEGEKDVETLRALGITSTTAAGGAGKWRDEYSKVFKGKKVVILQDDDEPGRKHAHAVAESISQYASEVRLVAPFPGAKDVSEWMDGDGTKKELRKIVADTKPFERKALVFGAEKEEALSGDASDDWRSNPVRGCWAVSLPESFLSDYLVLPEGIPFVTSLWMIGTFIFDVFDYYPYLSITSPTKRCGKTRLGEILELLCCRPLMSVNISQAALFRLIESEKPTLILDESEALRNRDSERGQSLNSILNAGFNKYTSVPRCVPPNFEVKKFSTFCPKAIMSIGNQPETLMDRSIVVLMRRHLPSEVVAPFRRRSASIQATGIASAISSWALSNKERIAQAYLTHNVDFLRDREADIWDPLFSIARIAVPERLDELKKIAARLSDQKAKSDSDDTIGLKVLSDLRTIFSTVAKSKLPTDQLLRELRALPENPWEDLTPIKLARLLRPFGVWPKQLGLPDSNPRGYELSDLKTVFARYLPSS